MIYKVCRIFQSLKNLNCQLVSLTTKCDTALVRRKEAFLGKRNAQVRLGYMLDIQSEEGTEPIVQLS